MMDVIGRNIKSLVTVKKIVEFDGTYSSAIIKCDGSRKYLFSFPKLVYEIKTKFIGLEVCAKISKFIVCVLI
jgi:hypothetical protein